MSWEEVQTRARQEVLRRLDFAFYRAGLGGTRNGLPVPAVTDGMFFFSPAELPRLIELQKSQLAAETAQTIREADEICAHRFCLLGYRDLQYGAEINWHLDIVHGQQAPLKPWFKINFLDFNEVGDHKIVWELNRHQHLVTLAKAWRPSHD